VSLSSKRVEAITGKQWESVSKTSENCKYCPHGKDIVEMGNYVISIMENNVYGGVSKDYSG